MQERKTIVASPVSIWAALLGVYIVWGSTYLAIRFAVNTIPPFLMASARFLIAGSLLYFFRRLRGDPAPTRAEWKSSAVIGLFLLVLGNGGVTWAEQHVVSGIAALMVASVPLWIVVFELLLSRRKASSNQRPTWLTILGVLVGFGGLILLIGPSEFTGLSGEVDHLGALVLVIAAFSWSIGSLYGRGAKLPASPLLGTGMEMLAGGAGLLILGTLSGEWGRLHLEAITTRSILGLVYLIVFGSLVGFASYTWLLRNAPTTLVSTYAYVNPVIAIFLGNIFDAEPLTPRVVIAAAIILGSVALITIKQPARTKVKEGIPAALKPCEDC